MLSGTQQLSSCRSFHRAILNVNMAAAPLGIRIAFQAGKRGMNKG